jgi:YD repeat-containing protein
LAVPQDAGRTPQPVTYEKKDAQGRLLTRITFNPDGTVHRRAVLYGPGAAKLTIDAELDTARVPTSEKRETLDKDGRLVERMEIAVRDGNTVKTRTTYAYDAEGRQTSTTTIE